MSVRLALPAALLVLLAGCFGSAGGAGKASAVGEPEIDFGVEASATTGVIRGVAIDEAIRPVPNAKVTIAQLDLETVTGPDGQFGFSKVEPGQYVVEVTKLGFQRATIPADVKAGVDAPPILKVTLKVEPSTAPYVEAYSFQGFLTCGVAIVLTSVGCTTFPAFAALIGDQAIWTLNFTKLPEYTQGELVWEHTQQAGGWLIWEAVVAGTNSPVGYRETTGSPALAYWNTTVLQEKEDDVLERGISYRFFGGPHPACSGVYFGCGVVLQQKVSAYIHNFYNFLPEEGWRFTEHGEPRLPA